MTEEFTAKLISLLSQHEGRKPFMYADSAGYVTVGVGHLLAKPENALGLGFIDENELVASDSQVTNAWNYVKASKSYYRGLTLPSDKIDNLLMEDVSRFYPVLIQTFPAFDSYPEPAQLALYDMVFNLGSFVKFPRFRAAVQAQNWEQAAAECHREGISDSRNNDTRQQLSECVS